MWGLNAGVILSSTDAYFKQLSRFSTTLLTTFSISFVTGCGVSANKKISSDLDDIVEKAAISVSLSDASVNEADGTVSVSVNLSAAPTSAVSINYTTANGTASAGSDFTAASGTLSWSSGEAGSKSVTLNITNDGVVEGNEIFSIVFSSATGASLPSTPNVTITIVDDDGPPSFTIAKKSGQALFTNTLPIEFTVTFSKAINAGSFTSGDISNTGTATGITWTVSSVSATVYTVAATVAGQGTLIPQIAAAITDIAGNANLSGATSSDTITYDTTAPGAFSISGVTGGTDSTVDGYLTNGMSATVNWGSSSGATSYDVLIRNAADTADVCAVQNTSSTSYAFSICPMVDGFSYNVKVTAKDAAGNSTAASNDPYLYVVDTSAPTLTFTKKTGQSILTNSLPIEFTATFSESITGFTAADISNTGTASGVTWTVTSVSGTVYTVAATVSGQGTLIPQIALAAVTDVAGLTNASSITSSDSITYDSTAPSAPSALTLFDPVSSPSPDTTPQISVSGVVVGDTVRVFTDACTTQVGSAVVASGTSTYVTTSALPAGASYTFYANSTDPAGNASTCSVATLSYTIGALGSFSISGITGARVMHLPTLISMVVLHPL